MGGIHRVSLVTTAGTTLAYLVLGFGGRLGQSWPGCCLKTQEMSSTRELSRSEVHRHALTIYDVERMDCK